MSLLFFSASCKKDQSQVTYFYSVTSEGDSIPHLYFATTVIEINDIRKIIQYRYYTDKKAIVDTLIEYYKLKGKELYKLRSKNDVQGECLLSVKTDTCVVYNHFDKSLNEALSSKNCFIGTQNIQFNTGKIETYVFNREVGKQEKVISKVYYNKSFILMKEEYLKGLSNNYCRVIVTSVPKEFSVLLNSDRRLK